MQTLIVQVMIHRIWYDPEIEIFCIFDLILREEYVMVVLLNQKQQARVYNSFYRNRRGILQMDDAKRRKQIDSLWSNLHSM